MDKILEQFGIEKIIDAVNNSNSYVDVIKYLELDYNISNRRKVIRTIKKLNLNVEKFDSLKKIEESKIRWNKDKLEMYAKTSNNYKEIIEKLNITNTSHNYIKLKQKMNEYNIDYSHLKNLRIASNSIWTNKVELMKIISYSKSKKDVLLNIGIRYAGNNLKTLDKYIKLYNIDISHFSVEQFNISKNFIKKDLSDILIEKSTFNRNHLKERLYKEGYKTRFCEECGQGEEWNGKHMSLILDHINGVHDDNRIENLRILCPNCNATLATHCGKHKSYRALKLIEKGYKSDDKIDFRKELSQDNLDSHINRRKVQRPTYEELKKDVDENGLEGVGRKYGVTGNAIKKWIKTYEKYGR